ncbi:nucleotidyltransferase family protein [Ferruginibacter sp. SUN106]|uniref:nucleotidyltransferase family protein n=1 Tax=Ferruginibacter sp. SUN106 TaxID=2978348 RepID=UPI003D36FDDF
MIKEAIILAGGPGTRLQTVVSDVPKCLAPVNGIPFINFIIAYLKNEGVTRFIFSLGYKSEIVTDYLDVHFNELEKVYVIEKEQLGTGGAVKKACEAVTAQDVVIVNGDTIFNISLPDLLQAHHSKNAACTIALNHMYDFERYGTAEFNKDGIITAFHEKKICSKGYINGGIYILNVSEFLKKDLPEKFSFEKDYLEKYVAEQTFIGVVFYSYFTDIGVPEDYEAFQKKYSDSPKAVKSNSSDDNITTIIEAIGTFFDLLH